MDQKLKLLVQQLNIGSNREITRDTARYYRNYTLFPLIESISALNQSYSNKIDINEIV